MEQVLLFLVAMIFKKNKQLTEGFLLIYNLKRDTVYYGIIAEKAWKKSLRLLVTMNLWSGCLKWLKNRDRL